MHEYYNYLVCGDRKKHYLNYFREKYVSYPLNILSLGCGNGHLERLLINMFNYPYHSITGIDINPELVKFAKEEALKLGLQNVHYIEADFNKINLPVKEFDLVIFFHSLHHVEKIEELLRQVQRTLTSDGLLLVVDFVGPSRFQWNEKQFNLASELLEILPDELRIDLRRQLQHDIKLSIDRKSIDDIIASDPSEAVRSSETMNLLKNNFIVLEQKPHGGTLLNLLFDGIAGNFDETDQNVRTIILLLQKLEEILIREGIISSDFVFTVLKNKVIVKDLTPQYTGVYGSKLL